LFSYLLSLIKWRNTSYFSWNTIQTVLVFYKKCCRVSSFTNQENIFYNSIVFFANVSDFVLCPRVAFFPIFYKRTMPYNKKLTDLNRSGNTGKYPTSVLPVLTSLSLGQYSKSSVGYFPVLPSLSVSKLLLLYKLQTVAYLVFGRSLTNTTIVCHRPSYYIWARKFWWQM
jgi:hypothetical protein